MLIHEIDDADVATVIDLWDRCGLLRPWNNPMQDIALARTNSTSTILVGLVDGLPAATAMAGFDGHRGWVFYVAVDPAHRRRGLGRQIMEAAEAWLRTQGAPKLQLMIRQTNSAVIDFYERLGFTDQKVVVMGKFLSAEAQKAFDGGVS